MLAYLSSQNVTVVTNLQGFVRFHYPGISAGEQHSQDHELCVALHLPWQSPVYTRLSTIRLASSCFTMGIDRHIVLAKFHFSFFSSVAYTLRSETKSWFTRQTHCRPQS